MLARKSLLIFLVNGLGAAGGLVGLFFIGRYMTPESYGMLGFALSLAGLVGTITNFGFDDAHVKRLSEGRDPADCLTTFAVIRLIQVSLYVGLMIGAALLWQRLVGFTDATSLGVMMAAVAFVAVQALQSIPAVTFNASRHTARTQSMNLLEHAVKVPGTVLVAMLFGVLNGRWVPFRELPDWLRDQTGLAGPVSDAQGATWLGIVMVAAITLSLVSGAFLLRRFGYAWGRFDLLLARDYARFAKPLAFGSAIALLSGRVDAVMLGYFWTATEVGYYYAAQRGILVLMIVPQTVNALFFPLMSQLARTHDAQALREVAVSAQRMLTLVIVWAAMLLAVFPSEGIAIFLSRSYLPAAPVLALLALQVLIASMRSVAGSIVKGLDRPGDLLITTAITTVANVTLNVLLIPRSIGGVQLAGLGPTGAALATVGAAAAGYVFLLIRQRRLLGATAWCRSNLKHLIAAVVVGAAAALTRESPLWGGLDRYYELGFAIMLSLLAYVGVLIALREVTQKDWILVRDLVHPGRMVRYVRDEMRRPERP